MRVSVDVVRCMVGSAAAGGADAATGTTRAEAAMAAAARMFLALFMPVHLR
ncbi:hypothetical protein ACGFJC_12150 [Nonomuraea fuscirosea]|uniref:hypothetical protein n=1 Tax=Nonomuraea fuscirosea TaxID=1291556 RepID=UPI002DD7B53F|nr:hypothetical protein [Nonomuraea fuscirosea]WSA55173.1 hypothetical protein OIE67_11365 [Nonomuraea fuscirosea]